MLKRVLKRVLLWLRSLVVRRRLEREMQEEMASHLERSTERLIERGLSAAEARRQAAREFGNVVYLQEEARLARGTAWLDALAADVRFALRHCARRPAATITMLVVLAIGMSMSTLLFSFVHSYATRPPAGMHLEDDLVRIRGSRSAGTDERHPRTFTEQEFLEYRKLGGHFAAVAGWTDAAVLLDAGEDPSLRGLRARATFVTENYFRVLGVRPVLGGGLPESAFEDAGVAMAAVISHSMWDLLFGADPAIIGRTVSVNDVPVTVVGVGPERFIGANGSEWLQLWLPLAARPALIGGVPGEYRAAGRLQPGVSADAATAVTALIAARTTAEEDALRELDPSTEVVRFLAASEDPSYEADVRRMSITIGALALIVLLVTCTNVSGLQMGLAAARRQEVAIRLSLGAPRRRLIRQLLTESALLAVVAGTAAVGVVAFALTWAARRMPGLPMEVDLTWPATAFTFGVALGAGILSGLSPALHATRTGVAGAMQDSSGTIAGSRTRWQRGMVVAQIAFTQPLIVLLATVLVLALGAFRPTSRTPVPDRVILAAMQPAASTSGSAEAAADARRQVREAVLRVRDELRSTAGIEAAVLAWGAQSALGAWQAHPAERVGGGPQEIVHLSGESVAPGHFELMSIPVLRGRGFTEGEVASIAVQDAEVPVIVDTDLARRMWAGADPVGRRLEAATDTAAGARTLVVVGVVDDPRAESRRAGEPYIVYLPPDADRDATAVLVRTAGPARGLLPTVRNVARQEMPGTIVLARTLADIEALEGRLSRMVTGGISAAGLIALLLSAIALYGVIAFSVRQRSGEIAVRMAFGARAGQIVRRFVGDGLRLTGLGLGLGLPASVLGLHLLTTLPGVARVALPPVLATAAAGVIVVAAAAAWIPARGAATVDPAVTLRRE